MELMAETSGAKVHRTDAMKAAIAVNRGAELYTFNIRHFEQFTATRPRLLQHEL
jgi:predicted nucleic acid-binding protein